MQGARTGFEAEVLEQLRERFPSSAVGIRHGDDGSFVVEIDGVTVFDSSRMFHLLEKDLPAPQGGDEPSPPARDPSATE